MTLHDYYLSEASLSRNQELKVGNLKRQILNNILKEKNSTMFYPLKDDLKDLPNNSILFKISFTLKKPYTSKDEGEFHIIDDGRDIRIFENPIVKDKFLGCPIVRPSTWKGHLRFASENVEWEEKEKIIKRLFGSKPQDENTLKGRLYFFSTFFKENGVRDVITPLDRKKRTPTRGPINLEVMKAGTNGEFYLLYLPYPNGNEFNEKEVKEDLTFLADALKLMFYIYGFSAKKTSGFGVIEEKLKEGKIWVKSGTNIMEKSFSKLDEVKNKIRELGWEQ
ncbi:MAG: RAMP superfamily CRISPR-associated protein [Candidatus Methanoperedens sp.]